MAIPILNHLDLQSVSELQNAILHKTTEGSASDIEGKLIYDTGTDTIKYYSGTSGSGSWISLTASASVTVSDSNTDTDFPVVFHDESNNLLDDTGRFEYNPNSGKLIAPGEIEAVSLDISGDIDIDGTSNLDVVDIDGAVDMATTLTLAGNADFNGDLDVDGTTNLDAVDIDGNVQLDGTFTVGVDGTGKDVKFFGDTASAYILWDESADKLLTAGGAVVDIVKDKLLIGSTAVTTTAAELNLLDTAVAGTIVNSKAVIYGSSGEVNATTLQIAGTAITSTAAEINLIDGGTSRGTDAVASGDGILINDGGTMKMTNVDTVSTYFASHNVGGSSIVTTGALNSGSITSGFGNIDNGSSSLDTGALTATTGTFVGDMSFTSDTSTFTSANSTDPVVIIKNTTNDTAGARLHFIKDKGAAGADGDDIGIIEFIGDDAAQTQTSFAKVIAEVGEADNTDEAGKLSIQVAASNGTTTGLENGLVLTGHKTGDYVDVTLGTGVSSTTTIAGNLTVSGTTTTVESTTLSVTDDLITVSKGNDTIANADGSGVEIDATGATNLYWKYVHSNTAWTSNIDIDVTSGNAYHINGTEVLGGTTLGSTIVTSSLTSVGALNSGSITSGFGTIDTGSSAITTTGLISGGSLDIDDVLINGTTIGCTGDTDLMTLTSNTLTVAGEVDATSLDISGDADIDGTLETDVLTINGTAIVAQATASEVGGVELATAAEVQTGTDTARVPTVDTLAAKSVVALIDVSELDSTELSARIAHSLGTKNLIVNAQLKGAGTDNQYCLIDWECTTDGSTDSSNDIYVKFAAEPASDVVVNITSINGGTTITPTYPS